MRDPSASRPTTKGPAALASAGGRGSPRCLPYDRDFRQAVEEGFLTVHQAVARGNRRTLGARLAARHGLPIDLALEVADCRRSLKSALEQLANPQEENRGGSGADALEPSRSGRLARLWPFLLAGLALAVFCWVLQHETGCAQLVEAERLVRNFERGKVSTAIDYSHSIYGAALAELDRVRPRSRCAERAAILRTEIVRNVAEFRERRSLFLAAERTGLDRRLERRQTLAAARTSDRRTTADDDSEDCTSHDN